MNVILIFIDGVGLGEKDKRYNPFVYTPTPFLNFLLQGNHMVREVDGLSTNIVTLKALDACLGVSGRPQSATGQASLFTGVNASQILGYHLKGFPNRRLCTLLEHEGIFLKLKKINYQVSFLNAYRPAFFIDLRGGLKCRYSCSTMLTYYAGISFRSLLDLKNKKALYNDITNIKLQEMGFQVSLISARKAGRRLVKLAREYDFVLYEYFLTDVVGHTGDPKKAAEQVDILDQFIGSVAESIDQNNTLVIITSDHGNLEDIREKKHTYNPVPALLIGAHHAEIAVDLFSIVDIAPAVINMLNKYSKKNIGNS